VGEPTNWPNQTWSGGGDAALRVFTPRRRRARADAAPTPTEAPF